MDKNWRDIIDAYEFKGVKEFYDTLTTMELPFARNDLIEELSCKIEDFLKDPDTPKIGKPKSMGKRSTVNFASQDFDGLVGIDMRGLLMAGVLAYRHDTRLVPVRKAGKLPGRVISQSYTTEYSKDTLCLQADKIREGERYIIIDDVVATGGSMKATADMISSLGGLVVAAVTVIELPLGGRELLEENGIPLLSLCLKSESNG